jgi:hypothetical protein
MAFNRTRDREYNAGNTAGRTFDDGQGARLLRPENRVTFDDSLEGVVNALIFAGIMQADPTPIADVQVDTINAPIGKDGEALTDKEADKVAEEVDTAKAPA